MNELSFMNEGISKGATASRRVRLIEYSIKSTKTGLVLSGLKTYRGDTLFSLLNTHKHLDAQCEYRMNLLKTRS